MFNIKGCWYTITDMTIKLKIKVSSEYNLTERYGKRLFYLLAFIYSIMQLVPVPEDDKY